ncbi:MAG: hypothetical protein CML50_13785 [Rhodobacteraceae bacterium]|uniref:DUF1127 domain-containing protein n=2 Tax=Roseobacteraceae TaxID=2854170 RepID=A0A1U7D6U3_9RHOB|nr:hypothetical protein Ga0080559_TMP2984 [Salipiger profundus]MAB07063.1 hypothetical protein [Paracoccaceae bacterium]GGA17908.1 hypothetical protein GCM10011326_33120 [Salipiger profundus]SFD29311.1 hypothetical protein SAMN05444415_10991 [Salipiger profundus]
MACFDLRPADPLLLRLARLLETPFARRQRQLAARVADLRALSDDELARLGLRRDQILGHVFGVR